MSVKSRGEVRATAHKDNYEVLINRAAFFWEDRDAWNRELERLILSAGDNARLERLNPKSIVRFDQLSDDGEFRARQLQNICLASIFELAPPLKRKNRRLELPGMYLAGFRPAGDMSDLPWPPAPDALRTKRDGLDGARALYAIAKYAMAMLGAYDGDEIREIAGQVTEWPAMLRQHEKVEKKFEKWAEKAGLGKKCPINFDGRNPDVARNRAILRELIEVHFYLVDPEGRQSLLKQRRDFDDDIYVQMSASWQKHADSLRPLSTKTWPEWWAVIWAKLNEERNGNVHLKPLSGYLQDLSDLGLEGARGYERARLVRRGMKPDKAIDLTKGLKAENGIWVGAQARLLEIDGRPINQREAKALIRKSLQGALRLLVRKKPS